MPVLLSAAATSYCAAVAVAFACCCWPSNLSACTLIVKRVVVAAIELELRFALSANCWNKLSNNNSSSSSPASNIGSQIKVGNCCCCCWSYLASAAELNFLRHKTYFAHSHSLLLCVSFALPLRWHYPARRNALLHASLLSLC